LQAEKELLAGHYEGVKRHLADLRRRFGTSKAPLHLQQRFFLLSARLAAAYEDAQGVREDLQKLKDLGVEPRFNVYADPPLLFAEWEKLKTPPVPEPEPDAEKTSPAVPPPTPTAPPLSRAEPDPVEARRTAQGYTFFVPFGVGHFAHDQYGLGTTFLVTDLAAVYGALYFGTKSTQSDDRDHCGRLACTLLSAIVPLTAYGLELNSHRDGLLAYSPPAAASVRSALGYFPLGLPQIRNDQIGKAVGIGAAQVVSLYAWVHGKDQTRTIGAMMFGLSYIFSVYDGWLHVVPRAAADSAWRLNLAPVLNPEPNAPGKERIGLLAGAKYGF
jgi:hypothetical protein